MDVVDSILQESVYQEAPPARELAGLVQCVWSRRVGEVESNREVRVVPDGCMDLLWMQGELRVAGPDTTAWVNRMPAGMEIFGLRFRPGVAAPLLRLPANQLINARLPAIEFARNWADRVTSNLEAGRKGRHTILQDAVRGLLKDGAEPDPLVQYVSTLVERANPHEDLRIANLADAVGISERQLHRRCLASLGYGMKTYARIVRFQRFLALQQAGKLATFAACAAEAGYADQAHLSRDVRQLTGLTPAELASGSF